jgi:hypothetical protein
MVLLLFAKRLLWSYRDAGGGTTSYYYSDQTTWIIGAVALAALVWFCLTRYLRRRALRRRPRKNDFKQLKRVIKLKRDLSSRYLGNGFSLPIHAVGIGRVPGTRNYCIQIFVSEVTDELATLPTDYFGVPLVLVQMRVASFLSDNSPDQDFSAKDIRQRQEVIVGGISGAHTNLTGESGTIGYFCTRKSKLPQRKQVCMLSNSHVFADLRKEQIDEHDLIMQPSPGERNTSRAVGTLVTYSRLTFAGDASKPNYIDAAVAKLWEPQEHKRVIPMIGAVRGYVETKNVELDEPVRKCGRTTEYTEGTLYSINLDIWVRYERVGKAAFFQDQFLVRPKGPTGTKFVAGGDSGSLLLDQNQYAVGLLFAGTSELPEQRQSGSTETSVPRDQQEINPGVVERIEGYGVANPICEVLDRLKIELLL